MNTNVDVLIIGGAAVGSAVAFFLSSHPDFDGSIMIVERDGGFLQSSTALSCASIRTQFSSEVNVRISQFGYEVITQFDAMTGCELNNLSFRPGGYLFLASDASQANVLSSNHEVQRACAADVVLWSPAELKKAFPHLCVEDLTLASYGRSGEGWFDNIGLMTGFRKAARERGCEYRIDEVVEMERSGRRICSITLAAGGTVEVGTVVNAAGARAAQVAQMAGIEIPVEARKRTVFVFDCADSPEGSAKINHGKLPLMVDPSGVYCRPEGRYFMAGCTPPNDCAVAEDDFEPRHDEFEDIIWPALAARSSAFEALKLISSWAGHYAYNTLDQNAIVGAHPEIDNFLFANGFSGHGLQQAPGVGRGIAELIVHGSFESLDLSPLGFERVLAQSGVRELAVV